MRTKRGGYAKKATVGRPRAKLKAKVSGGGSLVIRVAHKLPDIIRLAAISGQIENWRTLGPLRPIEPLNAGLKRYLGAGRR